MATKSIKVNGLNLVYEQDGAGPPLVFFHGGNGSVIQWEPIAPFLADRYTCIAVEQRGHGRSDRAPDADYSMRAMIDEAAAFLMQVVSEPAVLIGQSMGGAVSMGIAASHPERVRGVYSEDAALNYTAGTIQPFMLDFFKNVGGAVTAKERDGLSQMAFIAALGNALPALRATDPAGTARFARMIEGTDPAWYNVVTSRAFSLTDADAIAIGAGIRCPVHVAVSDPARGGLVTEEMLVGLREAGVSVTSTSFPGAGHLITSTHSRAMLDDLEAFLARLPV